MTGAIGAVRAWPRARVTRGLGAVADHWPAALALLSGTVAFAWAALLLVRRTEGLSAPAYDLAFFQQIIWNVGQDGRWISSFHVGSFLGLHFSPLLVVPAALERIVGVDARVPNVIHAAAVGALAPATFLFIRAALRPARQAGPVAAGLALMVPFTAAAQEIVRADFRPEAVGVVLALLAGWAGLTRRHRWMWALALIALTAREDVGYAVFAVALVVAARGRGRSRRHGLALAAIAVAWTVVVFTILMPWFRDGAGAQTDSYYRWLGGGIGVLFAPFNRTDAVIEALTRPPAWFVVAGMIVALAGLPLLRPTWLLLVAPPLAASLLSAHPPQHELVLQYALILVVPLTVASALGARRALTWATILRRRGGRRDGGRRATARLRTRVPHRCGARARDSPTGGRLGWRNGDGPCPCRGCLPGRRRVVRPA